MSRPLRSRAPDGQTWIRLRWARSYLTTVGAAVDRRDWPEAAEWLAEARETLSGELRRDRLAGEDAIQVEDAKGGLIYAGELLEQARAGRPELGDRVAEVLCKALAHLEAVLARHGMDFPDPKPKPERGRQ